MNNLQRFGHTTGLFLFGGIFLTKAWIEGQRHVVLVRESRMALLKTGAILLPLATLIGIATKKIFDDLGWQPSVSRVITLTLFPMASSIALASGAAVGFGLTSSFQTGWRVSAIALCLFGGQYFIHLGLQNIYQGANNRAPI